MGQVLHGERVAVPLGSVVLSTEGTKPMSITFLFRLISNLLSTKLSADEKQLAEGKVPHVRIEPEAPPHCCRRLLGCCRQLLDSCV